MSSTDASIKTHLHLFEHMIKSIVLYGSEIWGMFKTDSAAYQKVVIIILRKFIKTI